MAIQTIQFGDEGQAATRELIRRFESVANARGLVRFGRGIMDINASYPVELREAMLAEVPGDGPARSLGWFRGSLRGTRWFAHAGGGPAYYCELRIYPERGAASAIMLNRPGLSDTRLLDGIDPV